jgi:hypothetical protein
LRAVNRRQNTTFCKNRVVGNHESSSSRRGTYSNSHLCGQSREGNLGWYARDDRSDPGFKGGLGQDEEQGQLVSKQENQEKKATLGTGCTRQDEKTGRTGSLQHFCNHLVAEKLTGSFKRSLGSSFGRYARDDRRDAGFKGRLGQDEEQGQLVSKQENQEKKATLGTGCTRQDEKTGRTGSLQHFCNHLGAEKLTGSFKRLSGSNFGRDARDDRSDSGFKGGLGQDEKTVRKTRPAKKGR